ncbi:MAG: ABC transporter permease [Acidimicrobiales bacterium]
MNRRVASAARRLLDLLPAIAALVAGAVAWEVWVRWRDTPSYLLPPPSKIWAAFLVDRQLLGEHVLATLGEAMLGLSVGAVLGVGLAVIIAGSAPARRVLYPIVVASQTIPMIIMAPLLVLWFGFGLTPKVVVVAMVTFFPVAISTVGGLMSADPELVDLLRSMGASRRQVLTNVLIPNALPALFDGLRIAAAYTVAGAVIAEWTGASRGLGIYISRSQASFRVDQVFVAVTIVALLSTALFLVIGALARLASPWRYVTSTSEQREGPP